MSSRFASVAVCSVLIVGVSSVGAAPKTKLKLNGKTASTRVKVVSGVPMVPLADVAGSLGQSLVATSEGWEIRPAGGAYQAGKLFGKIGDVIQTPKYSFAVLGVQKTASYASQFLKSPRTFESQNPDDTFVIVRCRLKNTLPKAQGPLLSNSYAGNTALTDFAGTSYGPITFDSRLYGDFSDTSMLPGAQSEFALVFNVPKSAQLKDLVFSVTDSHDPQYKGVDVRVLLK